MACSHAVVPLVVVPPEEAQEEEEQLEEHPWVGVDILLPPRTVAG